ncbi:ABC transporter ATP-binding protein [Planctobacterium marinum]|uniref:ABC transporter ATP-binding protein n=1 Tax=Planctobacterium marinum TaxID=1631968 RepID=UPI001E319862|nr:ABC transporter ATP-binding protein [Planctobacterium marinum]MCC2607746.1 ABC transporter ATP-binding protein [Planctobacterium marinum]
MIKLTGISKKFETEFMETHALDSLDLTIYEGDYVSISGPSGCGKSTLLSIIGLLDSPTEGSYILDGEDVTTLSVNREAEFRNKNIGFIFQSFNLIDDMSVHDNVALPLRYSSEELTEQQVSEKVQHYLSLVGLEHRAMHKPNQLSGGQQQRVAIARALVNSPSILLVDEPTGNLDSKSGDTIMKLLDELNKNGSTICMVTHDTTYARYAKTQLHLLDGKIVEQNAEPERQLEVAV